MGAGPHAPSPSSLRSMRSCNGDVHVLCGIFLNCCVISYAFSQWDTAESPALAYILKRRRSCSLVLLCPMVGCLSLCSMLASMPVLHEDSSYIVKVSCLRKVLYHFSISLLGNSIERVLGSEGSLYESISTSNSTSNLYLFNRIARSVSPVDLLNRIEPYPQRIEVLVNLSYPIFVCLTARLLQHIHIWLRI